MINLLCVTNDPEQSLSVEIFNKNSVKCIINKHKKVNYYIKLPN